MPFYIQEKKSARGKYTMGRNAWPYRTREEARAMMRELNEHGGCGPMRIVNEKLEVQTEQTVVICMDESDRAFLSTILHECVETPSLTNDQIDRLNIIRAIIDGGKRRGV